MELKRLPSFAQFGHLSDAGDAAPGAAAPAPDAAAAAPAQSTPDAAPRPAAQKTTQAGDVYAADFRPTRKVRLAAQLHLSTPTLCRRQLDLLRLEPHC